MTGREKEYFNRTASDFYENYTDKSASGRPLCDLYLQLIRSSVRGRRILEVGCGPATFLTRLSGDNKLVIGVDFSEEMLRIAKKREGAGNLLLAEAHNLPLKDATQDFIFSVRTLQHVRNYKEAIGEMSRLLSKDGVLAIDAVNILNPLGFVFGFLRNVLFSPFGALHFKALSRRQIYRCLKDAGLELIEEKPVSFFPDYSNLHKLFPGRISKKLSAIFDFFEKMLKQHRFMRVFALRTFFVARKKQP